MKRLVGYMRQRRIAKRQQGAQEFGHVLSQMRALGRDSSLEQFQSSDFVARLRNGFQFCQVANMIYSNSDSDPTEVQKAIHLWKIAIEKGNNPAKYSYAMCMKKGIGLPSPQVDRANQYFRELANDGHDWGMFAYANALSTGDGVKKNERRAFELFKKCAEKNLPPAFLNVSNMYADGRGAPKNETEAVRWLIKAAEMGDPQAKAKLGERYYHGRGVSQNKTKAIELYTEAAARGVATAQFNLGYIFLTGDGVRPDSLQAETLFRRAADQGFVMAMVNLAQMYRRGYGQVPHDVDLARKWLELAAPHDTNAKELLGVMQENGALRGVHVDT